MAWTNPKTWADGEIPDDDILNTHIRDNLNAVSTHTHSGAAGDGSATLSGVDSITTDDAGSTPSAPGSNKVIIFSEGGVLKMRAGASGSALTFSTTNHSHTISEGSQTTTVNSASAGAATSYSGAQHTRVTMTPTDSTGSAKYVQVHFGAVEFTNANGVEGLVYLNFEKGGTQVREVSGTCAGSGDLCLTSSFVHVSLASSSTNFDNDYKVVETTNLVARMSGVREVRCQ
tara:strand:- start:7616 stop:8305 length:690 start_codon:yes stop_codon:yes gene_type:complete